MHVDMTANSCDGLFSGFPQVLNWVADDLNALPDIPIEEVEPVSLDHVLRIGFLFKFNKLCFFFCGLGEFG